MNKLLDTSLDTVTDILMFVGIAIILAGVFGIGVGVGIWID